MVTWRRGKNEGLASAEKGEVTFPAAHLAAHGGQDVINIPSGQLGAKVSAAQGLQTVLLHCRQTWNYKTGNSEEALT